MGWHNDWWWGFGFVPMVLFWGAFILLIVLGAKWLSASAGGIGGTGNRALDVLRERYARGEIGKDEFEQKKRDVGA